MFSQRYRPNVHFRVSELWSGITGRNSLYEDNGDRLLSQTCSLTTATVLRTPPRKTREDVYANVFVLSVCGCLQWNKTRYSTPDTMIELGSGT